MVRRRVAGAVAGIINRRAALLFSAAIAAAQSPYRDAIPAESPAIQYSAVHPSDRAAALAGCAQKLDLTALLRQFGIDSSSQMLVFSKDSFQAAKISPHNPRAIYFTDDVTVAAVRGSSDMEIAAVDPRLGPMFYKYSAESGQLTREPVCLRCHQGAATLGVPGVFVGSTFPDVTGAPSRDGAIITDHRTPLADRWGGWYVTAIHGEQADRANGVAADPAEPHAIANQGRRNLSSLDKLVNLTGYLEPTSDIVALMTFEHQTQLTNLFTRLEWEARVTGHADVAETAAYMTFAGEVALPEPVEGASRFAADFARRGPRDRQGRSLRDFDLQTRLFRYPLSYMIYSAQFDALPAKIQADIYRRLFETLSRTSPETIAIVRDTKKDLPEYWRNYE